MKQTFNKLTRSTFVRNVAIVASGTAGAQVITMAFAPIITRMYDPEAFGLLGTFIAILAIVTPIAALTYPIAIVLPKSDTDALGLAKLSAGLAFLIAIILTFFFLLAGDWIAELLNLQAIAGFLLLIPLAMLFSVFQEIIQQWLIRKQQFIITTWVTIIQSLVINLAKIGGGWFHPVGAMLVVLTTAGYVLNTMFLWLALRKQSISKSAVDELTTRLSAKRNNIKILAKRYSDFPLYRAPQVAINALSQSLPVLMLASFFGPSAAGFYALARTVLAIPTTLIGKSVGDVFYPRVAQAAHNNENLFQLILKATLALAALGLIPFTIIIIFGPWLFTFVFGIEWLTAGDYARWLAIWLFFMFINKPCVVVIPLIKEQLWLLYYELFSTCTKIIALFLGFFLFKDDQVAVILFSISGAIAYIYLIMTTLFKTKRYSYAKAS